MTMGRGKKRKGRGKKARAILTFFFYQEFGALQEKRNEGERGREGKRRFGLGEIYLYLLEWLVKMSKKKKKKKEEEYGR